MNHVFKNRLIKDNLELFNIKKIQINCNIGWYNLLNVMCKQIQDYIDKNNKTGKYLQIVDPIHIDKVDLMRQPNITKVSSKNNVLEITVIDSNQYIDGIVNMAQAISTVTCNQCSKQKINKYASCIACFNKQNK